MEINKIYLGNAYELIKQVPDKSVDLIVTDPPYDFQCAHGRTGFFKWKTTSTHYAEEIEQADLGKGIDVSILREFVRVMKKINCYIWCNKEQIYDYMTFFVKERKCNFEFIIWAKSNIPPFTNGHYLKDKEYCLYFWEKGVKVKGTYATMRTVYETATNQLDKELYSHPTIKPLGIISNLIINSSGGGATHIRSFLWVGYDLRLG